MDRKSVAPPTEPHALAVGDHVKFAGNPHSPTGIIVQASTTGYYVRWHTSRGEELRHHEAAEVVRAK